MSQPLLHSNTNPCRRVKCCGTLDSSRCVTSVGEVCQPWYQSHKHHACNSPETRCRTTKTLENKPKERTRRRNPAYIHRIRKAPFARFIPFVIPERSRGNPRYGTARPARANRRRRPTWRPTESGARSGALFAAARATANFAARHIVGNPAEPPADAHEGLNRWSGNETRFRSLLEHCQRLFESATRFGVAT